MSEKIELNNPIIFIGTGRSGTTIISEIVMNHKDIAFPSNYLRIFYKYPITNLIRNFFDNKFWRKIGQKKQLNKVNFFNKYIFKPVENYEMWNFLTGKDLEFSRNFLIDEKVNDEKREYIRRYFYKMLKYQNRKRLAFKITGPSRISFLLSIFPDAYFINLKRSLIPTISSFLKVNFWTIRGYNDLWWTGAYTTEEEKWVKKNIENPILLTAFQLKKIIEVTKYELKTLNPNYIELEYEDFVEDPKKELLKIIKFVKLDNDISYLDNYLDKYKIYNRNKSDHEYFSDSELKDIYNIIK